MSTEDKFKFVTKLAADLNKGDVKLPSFPDVTVRVRTALDDPDCSSERLADIINTEPTLASRVLVYANSAHYNPAGAKIVSLTNAVSRLGFKQLRSVAVTYAVEQIQLSESLDQLRDELRQVWQASLRIGAMCEAFAGPIHGVDQESAFIAGLLHRIGSLYIFQKYHDFPDLISDVEARTDLQNEWEGAIGESILTSWDFPEDIVATANISEENLLPVHTPGLIQIVMAAKELTATATPDFTAADSVPRLGLTESQLERVATTYQSRLAALSSAVAG